MTQRYRVFLSAVSTEFRSVREQIATDLRRRGLEVREQADFRMEATAPTLLRKLHDYIQICDALVCLIGRRSGAAPPTDDEFRHHLPQPFSGLSYTQWEFVFARVHNRACYLFNARDYPPEEGSPGDEDAAQTAFFDWMRSLGRDRTPVRDRETLRTEVLILDWPFLRDNVPNNLRYASLGANFVGRTADLTRLRAALNRPDRQGAAITSLAVQGLGGVGKTRLALEYAHSHAGNYRALLFVEAETPETLQTNLAALGSVLGLAEAQANDPQKRLRDVLDWLGREADWLLILDNVDTPQALAEVNRLTAPLRRGHLLLTSRLHAFPATMQPVSLDLLSRDDAAAFLLRRTERERRAMPDDAEQARALAGELDRLCLALEQAGAFIAAQALPMTLAEYRRELGESFEAVMGWADAEVMLYPRSVAATWRSSVERLDEPARALLERLAFFAPDPIPASLLQVACPGANGVPLRSALNGLAKYSLVTAAADGGSFTVHRLVQDVTRRGLSEEAAHARLTEALGWVADAFVGDPSDVRSWPVLEPLVEHASAVAWHGHKAKIDTPTARLLNQIGIVLYTKSQHNRAEKILRASLDLYEASLGSEHPTVATSLNNLATLLQATNRAAEAEPLIRRALAITEKSLGPDHPNVATTLNNLALLLRTTNRAAEAEPLFRRALAITEKSLGPDHPNVATTLNNLALLLQNTNRVAEAEPLFRRALAITEKSLGPDHPYVATSLNNLAIVLQATNRAAEAEPLFRRALAITEKSLGPDHPNVATTLNNLALLLQNTNRVAEAEPLFRRALAITEKSLGPDHPYVATSLNNLAIVLQATNRAAEAEPLIRRALAITEKSLGPDHPTVATKLNNLAILLRTTNRAAEAEPLIRRALAIDEASFGLDHPEVATDLNNLATLLRNTNRSAEAEPLFRRVVVILLLFQRMTGHTHPNRNATANNYEILLQELGRTEAEIGAIFQSVMQEAGLA